MADVTEQDAHERELHEAEQLLAMQIADFEGEEIDPEDEPDLYLPLSAAQALHKALSDQAATLISAQGKVEELREKNTRLRVQVGGLRSLLHDALPYVTKCADMDLADAVACMMIIEHELDARLVSKD